MSRFEQGVAIGKFLPYHRGHRLLIETAERDCDEVHVIVCERDDDSIPGPIRRGWITATHPNATVHLVDQTALGLADDDTDGWAAVTRRLVGRVDAVFTSEDYGDRFAAAVGGVHVEVDRARSVVPVSGTAVRGDPFANAAYLDPAVRAFFVKRVCIFGAESTGKTTLACDLAERYGTVWVPEYGHVYQALGRAEPRGPWTADEFRAIARIQAWYEDALAEQADRVLFCDTDVFATAVWQQRLMSETSDDILALAHRRYDLYVVPDLATPFTQDEWSLRDDGPHRGEMQSVFLEHARASGVPVVEPTGTRKERVEQVAAAVERLFV